MKRFILDERLLLLIGFGMFRFRLSYFFVCLFLFLGTWAPFLPLWLYSRGLSASEIGICLAFQIMARVIAGPIFSFIADYTSRPRFIIRLLSCGVLFSLPFFYFCYDLWSLIFMSCVIAVFFMPIISLFDAYAVSASQSHGFDYGRMRLCGSLSFMFATVSVGLLLLIFSPDVVLIFLFMSQFFVVLSAFLLPTDRIVQDHFSHSETHMKFSDFGLLLYSPVFLLLIFGSGLIQSGHAFYYGFSVLHWESLGYNSGLMGLLWSVGVLSEVLLFFFSRYFLFYFRSVDLIILGGAASILRWFFMGYTPSLSFLFVLQCLHAFTFAAVHLGVVHFISRYFPSRVQNTAQGINAIISGGVLLGFSTLLSSHYYSILGGKAYFMMSLISLVGFILMCFLVYYLRTFRIPITPLAGGK